MRNQNPHPHPHQHQHQQGWTRNWQQQGLHPNQQHAQQYYPDHQNMQHQQTMYRQISIEDAINIAREQIQGQVVKVELERKGGRLIYEVDIVNPQGVKYEVKIDANTGAVLEVELD